MSLFRRLLGNVGDDDDARLIARLDAAGVDLSRPIMVEHFLTLPDERQARQAVAKLGRTGGTVGLVPVLLGRRWTVRFAAEHGGVYEGWGTSGDDA
jgi:hypothetical protein